MLRVYCDYSILEKGIVLDELNQLIVQAQLGKIESYNKVVLRLQDMAVGYAYSKLGDFHLAEDISQDAFIKAYQELPNLREPAAFLSWFQKIIHTCCLQIQRQKHLKTASLDMVIEIATDAKNPAEVMEEQATKDWVLGMVEALPEHERTVITLFYINEYSHREIAAFLNISLYAVNNHLRASRKKLKERVLGMMKKKLQTIAPSRNDYFANFVNFRTAVESGDLEQVSKVLIEQPNMVHRGNSEWTALHYAAMAGQAEVAKLLIESGADITKGVYPDRSTTTPLALVLERGHDSVVLVINEYLSEQNDGDISDGLSDGFREAILEQDYEKFKAILVSEPENISKGDSEGNSPLHLAVQIGHFKMVVDLIVAGSHIDAVNYRYERPIHKAIKKKHQSPDLLMVGLLLGHGASYDICIASAIGDVGSVKTLLKEDRALANLHDTSELLPNANSVGFSHDAPLTLAAWYGYFDVVELLLDSGADPNAPKDRPLTLAAGNGHLDVVQLLLDSGADPDATRDVNTGWGEKVFEEVGFPLWYAADQHHLSVAKLLLEKGASVVSQTYGCGTAMERAQRHDYEEMIDLLASYGAQKDLGMVAAKGADDSFDVIKKAFEKDPEMAKQSGGTLRLFIMAGRSDLVEYLLSFKPQFHNDQAFGVVSCATAWSPERGGDRYLKNGLDIIKMLLDYGQGLSAKALGNAGETPLHWMCAKKSSQDNPLKTEIAELLLDYGADIDAIDADRQMTPLGWAARLGQKELVEFFLSKGADPNLPDDDPKATPLVLARMNGHSEIVELIENHLL